MKERKRDADNEEGDGTNQIHRDALKEREKGKGCTKVVSIEEEPVLAD